VVQVEELRAQYERRRNRRRRLLLLRHAIEDPRSVDINLDAPLLRLRRLAGHRQRIPLVRLELRVGGEAVVDVDRGLEAVGRLAADEPEDEPAGAEADDVARA